MGRGGKGGSVVREIGSRKQEEWPFRMGEGASKAEDALCAYARIENEESSQPEVWEQKRHIKLLHIKLFPAALVTGPPGRVSGQKDLCSLGSEDST